MLRRYWKKIVLLITSIVFPLVIAELILDLMAEKPSPRAAYLGRVMPTGGEWDANGFRNPKVPTQVDIVAIGDSQTEGRNAKWNEAWPYVLADKSGASVYSLALGGYGPVQYDYLADMATPLHPRLAIVGFYFGNDVLDSERITYQRDVWTPLRDPSYVRPSHEHSDENPELTSRTSRWRNWMRNHSRLYALVGDATYKLRSTPTPEVNPDQSSKEVPDFAYIDARSPPLSTALSPTYRVQTLDPSDPETKEGWRITQGRLLDLKKKFIDAHTSLVILMIPTKEKVYLEYMQANGRGIPEEFTTYAQKEIKTLALVKKFCDDNGFSYIEVLPDMVKAMQSGIMLYRTDSDGHPNRDGYRVIGEALYRHLEELKYLPLD